jgi:hypothetical protein
VKVLSASGVGLTSDGEDVECELVVDCVGAPPGGPLATRTVVADVDPDPIAAVAGRESGGAGGCGTRGLAKECAACQPVTVGWHTSRGLSLALIPSDITSVVGRADGT